MKKTIIAPIVSAIAMGAALIFHKQIPADVQNQLTDVTFTLITLGTVLYGIFKDHKKQAKEDAQK